jgi:hypothetical protein
VTLAGIGVMVCAWPGVFGGLAAFAPPPDTKDSDALHWHSMERSLGWYALGLAVASIGCFGWVITSGPRKPVKSGTSEATASMPSSPASLLEHVAKWAPRSISVVLLSAGSGLVLYGSPTCFTLLFCVGLAFLGGSQELPRKARGESQGSA